MYVRCKLLLLINDLCKYHVNCIKKNIVNNFKNRYNIQILKVTPVGKTTDILKNIESGRPGKPELKKKSRSA